MQLNRYKERFHLDSTTKSEVVLQNKVVINSKKINVFGLVSLREFLCERGKKLMQKVDFKINKQTLLNNFSNMSKQLSKMNDFSPAGPPLSGRKLQIALFQRQDKVHNLTAPHAQGVQLINVLFH